MVKGGLIAKLRKPDVIVAPPALPAPPPPAPVVVAPPPAPLPPARAKVTAKKAPRQVIKKPTSEPVGPAGDKVKKPHRFHPGTKAKLDIRRQQKSTNLLIPKTVFVQVAREIGLTVQTKTPDLRFAKDAFGASQSSAENFVIRLFTKARRIAKLCGRVTIQVQDIREAALSLKGR